MNKTFWEPVFDTDMKSELEYAMEGYNNFMRFYERLIAQRESVELINQMGGIVNTYVTLAQQIKDITPKLTNERKFIDDTEGDLRLAAESVGSPRRTPRGD